MYLIIRLALLWEKSQTIRVCQKSYKENHCFCAKLNANDDTGSPISHIDDKNVVQMSYRDFRWVHCRGKVGGVQENCQEIMRLNTGVVLFSTDILPGCYCGAVGVGIPSLLRLRQNPAIKYGVYNFLLDSLATT